MTDTRFRPAMGFIFVTAVLDIMALGLVIPVLPPLIKEFAGSEANAGYWSGGLIAIWAGMQFVFSPMIGALSDRLGRRPVILVSAAGLACDWVLMALAPNLSWLVVGRIIGGLTSASFPAIFAYMADITPPEGRAKAFGMIGAAFSAGFVAGPALGGVLGELGPRAPFWAAAVLSAIAFLYGLFVLPESLTPEKRMPFAWRRANPFGALKLLRSHPELSGLAIVNFALYFSHHIFSAIFVLYAGHRYGWGPFEVGLLLAFVGVLDMLVQGLLTGPVVKRFGDRRTMVFGLIAGAIGITCMGLAPDGHYFILAMLPNALWGLAMPTIQSLMTVHVSESEQGQLQGANNSVGSIAGVASPLFFGWLYGLTVDDMPGAGFLVAALILLGAAGMGAWAGRRV